MTQWQSSKGSYFNTTDSGKQWQSSKGEYLNELGGDPDPVVLTLKLTGNININGNIAITIE